MAATDAMQPLSRTGRTDEDTRTSAHRDISSLESKALSATVWIVSSYALTQCFRFLNSAVLTRLLMPSALGEMTLVSTIIIGMTMLSDIGLEPSVIQSKRGDDLTFLNTAWSLQACRGCILWFLAVLFAWPAGRFYNDTRLAYVLPILALSTLVTGLTSTNLLTLARHMGVRRLFAIDLSTQVVTIFVTIAWAHLWPSVWALVAGNVAGNTCKVALSHSNRVAPGIRNRFRWDPSCLRDIMQFGKWIFLGTAFWFFATQSDRLILGKLVPLTVLGVYGVAYSFSDMPRGVINAFSVKVGYPFISRIIYLPRDEFRQRFLRYRLVALATGGLFLSVMVTWGGWAMLRVYPPSYAAGAWIVPVLAAGLWHTLLHQTTAPVLYSLGKSKYAAVGNACYCAAIVFGIPAAFACFHLIGAVVAVAAGDFPLYIVILIGATRHGIKPLRQDTLLTGYFVTLVVVEHFLRRSFH